MKSIKSLILVLIIGGCNKPNEKTYSQEQIVKTAAAKTKESEIIKNNSEDKMSDFDSLKTATERKKIEAPIPIPPKTVVVEKPYIEPIKCFNPNLKIDDVIELINSLVENTQWFIVENKKVDYQHTKLDQTDTIWIKEKLLKTDWKLINSSQTNIGNQNKIKLRMRKENSICTIEKKLYLADKKNHNLVEEWFQVKIVK